MDDKVLLDLKDIETVSGGEAESVAVTRCGVRRCPYCSYATGSDEALARHMLSCVRRNL